MTHQPAYVNFQTVFHIGVERPNRLHLDQQNSLVSYKYPLKPREKIPLSKILKIAVEIIDSSQLSENAVPVINKILNDLDILKKRYDKKVMSLTWKIKKKIAAIFLRFSLIKANPYDVHEKKTMKALNEFEVKLLTIKLSIKDRHVI